MNAIDLEMAVNASKHIRKAMDSLSLAVVNCDSITEKEEKVRAIFWARQVVKLLKSVPADKKGS